MAKPIILIRLTEMVSREQINIMSTVVSRKVDQEYHVLVVSDITLESPVIEVLNGDDLDPVTIEELKEKLNLSNG